MKKKVTYWLFRLRSSRGTDMCHCLKLPYGLSSADVRQQMEYFAERCTANTACQDYGVTYKRIRRLPPRKELLKKYDAACKRKQKAKEAWQALAAQLNPRVGMW